MCNLQEVNIKIENILHIINFKFISSYCKYIPSYHIFISKVGNVSWLGGHSKVIVFIGGHIEKS